MKKGLTLLEVLVSLVLLTLFILGGMSLYATSVSQTRKSEILLTEIWLAKGKLDNIAESQQPLINTKGKFQKPFENYSFTIKQTPLEREPSLELLTIRVDGPSQTHTSLERIRQQMLGINRNSVKMAVQ